MGALTEAMRMFASSSEIWEGSKTAVEMGRAGMSAAQRTRRIDPGAARQAAADVQNYTKPLMDAQSAVSDLTALEERRAKVLKSMKTVQDSYAHSAARAASNGDKAQAEALKERITKMGELRSEYEKLAEQERQYMSLRARAAQLQGKGSLTGSEAEELKKANEQIAEMKPQFESIAEDLREASKFSSTLGDNMSGDVASGTEKSADNMRDFKDDSKEAAKQSGIIAKTWGKIKDLKGEFVAGLATATVFAELNTIADKAIEVYYGYGQSLENTGYGLRSLAVDTWNLAKMQTRLSLSAARMNMPMEAANDAFVKLSQSVRLIYGKDGKIRTDIAADAIENILAFSRVTGSSVDQATELYARLVNQFGKSHTKAKEGLNSIARSGQLVNETLKSMGVDGSIFLNDLTGVLNDAAQAFDGFTLNVDYLSARVSHAVKVGKELGMTYNQSMDVAKQMTGIFSKPGGYLGFQAGEQLRQDLEQAVRGVEDAEERARILSTRYGISTSTARTLDIARKDVNAQMQVMEIMKGTDAGMQKQFDLMRGIANGNSQSLEVFKQFVGGENLSPEQAGDLLQVLQKGGGFEEFKIALGSSKDKAGAASVIDQSIMAPTMIKEIMKALVTSPEYHAWGLLAVGGWKFMQKLTKVMTVIASIGLLVKLVKGIPQFMSNIKEAFAGPIDRFTSWFQAKTEMPMSMLGKTLPSIAEFSVMGKEVFSDLWRHVKSGSVFDKLGAWLKISRDYLSTIARSSFDVGALLRTGAAKVQTVSAQAAALAERSYASVMGSYKDTGASVNLDINGALDKVVKSISSVTGLTGDASKSIEVITKAALAKIGMANGGGLPGTGGIAGSPDFIGPQLPGAGSPDFIGPQGMSQHKAARRAKAEALRAKLRDSSGNKLGRSGRMGKAFSTARSGFGKLTKVGAPLLGPLKSLGWLNSPLGQAALMGGIGLATTGFMSAVDAGVTNSDNPDEEDNSGAGGRKYGEDLSQKRSELGDLGEALEAARATGDQALIDALASEAAAKEEELKVEQLKKSKLDTLDKSYTQKLVMIKTIKSRIERLKDLGRDEKEIKAQEDLLSRLEKEAGEAKGKINAEGADTSIDKEKWGGFGTWLTSAQGVMRSALSLLNLPTFAGAWANIAGAASWLKDKIGAGFGWAIKNAGRIPIIGPKIASVIAKVGGVAEKYGLGRMLSKLGAGAKFIGKWVPGVGDLLQGVTDGIATEGSMGKKLFVGAASTAGSFAARSAMLAGAAGLGIGTAGLGTVGSIGMGVASAGAGMAGGKAAGYGAEKLWNSISGEGPGGVDAIVPDSSKDTGNAPIQGANMINPNTSQVAATGVGGGSANARGRWSAVDSAGKSQLIIDVPNTQTWMDSGLMRLSSDKSGLSGR